MGTANVVSLFAQPLYVSYLCFEVGGILDTCPAELGRAVESISYTKLCAQMREAETVANDPSQLTFDSQGIADLAEGFSLASLRNEDRKSALDSAVGSRQNLFYSKYANAASVISTIRANYSQTEPVSKWQWLETLIEIAQQQYVGLADAYAEDDRLGVVRETSSSLRSSTKSSDDSGRFGIFLQESAGKWVVPDGVKIPQRLPPAWTLCPDLGPLYDNDPNQAANAAANQEKIRFPSYKSGIARTTGTNFELSASAGNASGVQTTAHTDYDYRTPLLEARARHCRAQISLRDQRFELYMFQQNMPHLEQIFSNELRSIDSDIYQLQLALLRSFLIAPLPGIVTGIYKREGEAVSAGEPVLRIEDNGTVHLVASLVYFDSVRIDAPVTVTTTLHGAQRPATTVPGKVVAARGQGSSGRLEVIIRVDNNVDANGDYIIPLNHSFDPEFTEVNIT